jgi:hypothetical protein
MLFHFRQYVLEFNIRNEFALTNAEVNGMKAINIGGSGILASEIALAVCVFTVFLQRRRHSLY